MDQLGLILAEAVMSREWEKAYGAGTYQAFRIGEQTRIDQALDRTALTAELASRYLEEVLQRLERYAEVEAAKSYGRYRWLWYLRRVPDFVFSGRLASTGPYNRRLTEILATRGAGPAHALRATSADGTFPLDGTAMTRIAWICGFAEAFRHYQVVYRVVGEGGGMAFDQSHPGLPFPVPKSQRDDVLDRALEEFDLRNIQSNVLANIGIPIESFDPKSHRGERTLFQMGKVSGLPPIATAEEFDLAHTVAMRYAPSAMPLRAIIDLMARGDQVAAERTRHVAGTDEPHFHDQPPVLGLDLRMSLPPRAPLVKPVAILASPPDSVKGGRLHLRGPRQCLSVDILPDVRQFAISNGDGEDPMVLERPVRGFDSPRSEADDENPVSLSYEFARFC
jgi:hypothetical protein